MAKNPVGFQVTDAAAGWNGTDFDDLFIRKDCFLEGGLWLWGFNGAGRLGNNSVTNSSSPVQTISGGTNWKQVSIGAGTISAIKTDGTLWLWGSNYTGGLGNNSIIDRSSPVQTISGGTNWKQVSTNVAVSRAAAVKTDGTLWAWGTGYQGTLGNNNTIDRSSPVQTISGGTNWKFVSLSQASASAIKTDGTLWSWGRNNYGILGNNNTIDRSSPVQTISGGTNWKSVSSGYSHVAAIKTDGTLWLWGCGYYGGLGNNRANHASSPVQTISGGTNWKQVSVSGVASAIKTDGTLWIWGRNNYGKLGNNSAINTSSPVQTISGGTNWKQVSAGASMTAIKTDGTLWVWAQNSFGGLGDNSIISKSSPVQTVSGGTNWRLVDSSGINVAAIREGCW